MDGGTDEPTVRECTNCGEPVPADRSVCPACGSLQRSAAAPRADQTEAAGAEPDAATRARPMPGAGAPTGEVPTVAAEVASFEHRRSSPWKAVVVVLVLLVLIAGGTVAAIRVADDGDGNGSATTATTTSIVRASDPRVEAVQRFCDTHQAITKPANISTFVPGQGAVAYVEVPQPASATTAAGYRVVQVSPEVGKPDLSLTKSVGFISLAVCVEQSATPTTGATCDYRLTEGHHSGDRRRAPLLQTTYRARIFDLRSGRALVTDKLTTAIDTCPKRAYLGGKGVSNPLTVGAITAWIAQHMPGGKPV